MLDPLVENVGNARHLLLHSGYSLTVQRVRIALHECTNHDAIMNKLVKKEWALMGNR